MFGVYINYTLNYGRELNEIKRQNKWNICSPLFHCRQLCCVQPQLNFSKRIEKPLLTVLKPFTTIYFKRLDSSKFTLDAKNHIKILRERQGGNRSVIESESDSSVTKTGGVGRVICQQRQVTQSPDN